MKCTNLIYNEWLKSTKVSKIYKEQMQKFDTKQINSYFCTKPLNFGTAGIRGTMGPGTGQMNEFTYTQYAIGYGKYILKHFPKNPAVVIGHDNRLNSDKFSLICANVLTSLGIKAYLFENNHLTPTPIISYCIRAINAVGGIIVTASHNPKEYNGFKVYNPDGGQILPEAADEITKYMPSCIGLTKLNIKPNKNLIRTLDESIVDSYFIMAQKALVNRDIVNHKKDYPIVITTHHGTASEYLPKFLKSLNFNVLPVKEQCFPNPNFINSPSSNPEYFDSFNLATKLAEKNHAKIMLGIDPDADRMAVMVKHNNKWRLMTGNEMGIIYTFYLLNNRSYMNQTFIASSYVSTNYIDLIAKDFNTKIFRTGTGFKWMGHVVSENDGKLDFVVAFEEAIGALNTNINRDKDSFTASLLALEIHDYCVKNKMDLVDYLEKVIFKKYGNWFGKTDSFIISGLDWKNIAIKKMEFFKNFPSKKIGNYQIKTIKWNPVGDCLEWDLNNNNWIKFRMSGTEPKFKVYYNLMKKPLTTLNCEYKKLHNIFAELIEK